VYFVSILVPFWRHLGSIWSPSGAGGRVFGGPGVGAPKRLRKVVLLGCFGGPRGPHFSTKINHFFDQKMHHFFDVFFEAFGIHFGRPLGAILHPKTCLERKMQFCQNERFVYTRAQFWRVRCPRNPPKGLRKSIPKCSRFFH